MKLRLLTGLAIAMALGGCASYGYVGAGGGYYSGYPATTYRYDVHGAAYPYYPYYTPGWSLGLGYYGGGYYPYPRVIHHYHRPPAHGPRPDGGHRPPGPGGGPSHHPPPPSSDRDGDRAPWRDLDRVRRAKDPPPASSALRWQACGHVRRSGRSGAGQHGPADAGPGRARRSGAASAGRPRHAVVRSAAGACKDCDGSHTRALSRRLRLPPSWPKLGAPCSM